MSLALKPTHATVKAYYETLHQYSQLHIDHEGAVRSAFQTLLAKCGQRSDPKLTLVPEYRIKRARGSSVIVDGALIDLYHLPHGYWEAKDEKDDLLKEVQHKLDKGYPSDNTIFQAPERAILYQGGTRIFDENISRPEALVSVVNQFFTYKAPRIEEWLKAVDEFSERVPELSQQVENLIKEERRRNPAFLRVFQDFYELCRQSINPNLSEKAVEGMLVQHLLTERIFRRIFKNDEFRTRNVVAVEIEKVIVELTKRSLNRDDFLKRLEPFYHAIERNAENATGYAEKQDFLNTVYMRFFQGYSPKDADTHGIVYTPQPIVNFMVRSVEEILQKEFGRSLGDKGVHILDPFVGTGNFIVRIMQEIKATDLQYKYENELHCNEVMLLPYYIASMNIEHAYFDRSGEYRAFPGICLVDTFELAEPGQGSFGFMTAENAERVKRQKDTPIFVAIGNPPYNVGQASESDQNKNRLYPHLDGRIRDTYGRRSKAINTRALSDHYVRAIRWASDRIGEEGVIAFVTNNNFLESLAADGMRACLAEDFSDIYVLDLGGNVRKNPKLSGTTHNVFGIQVGVGISLLVRKRRSQKSTPSRLFYSATDEWWRKEQKYSALDAFESLSTIDWVKGTATSKPWQQASSQNNFESFTAMTYPSGVDDADALRVFDNTSRGVETARDEWAYNFDAQALSGNIERLIEFYNDQQISWKRAAAKDPKLKTDDFIKFDDTNIKWSSSLRSHLDTGVPAEFNPSHIRMSIHRPFVKKNVYYDSILTHRRGSWYKFLPTVKQETENRTIVATDVGMRSPFSAMCVSVLPDFHLCATTDTFRGFPFYTYAEDGSNRRENITGWALEQFRARYHDPSIGKWDIFHYIYAVLHHPEYRERYAANLRRELPRIPFVSATTPESCHSEPASAGEESASSAAKKQIPRFARNDKEEGDARSDKGEGDGASTGTNVFRSFVRAGERLAEIHVHYEKQAEYPLTKTEKAGEKLDWRVTKMRLSKDKTTLIYNQFLTLSGIPKETYDYRLGNRSALEWVIDQYQVSTDKRSGITNDPNRDDDQQYILRLVCQVITISLETVRIVNELPALGIAEASGR
jgi:predicted helicase